VNGYNLNGGGANGTTCLFAPDETMYFAYCVSGDTIQGAGWTGWGDSFMNIHTASSADQQRCLAARQSTLFTAPDQGGIDAGAIQLCTDGGADALAE